MAKNLNHQKKSAQSVTKYVLVPVVLVKDQQVCSQESSDNYSCTECKKVFKSKELWKKHMLSHKDKQSSSENKALSSKGKSTQQSKLAEKQLPQNDMGTLGTISSLSEDIPINDSETGYSCDVCHIKFKTKGELSMHSLIHNRLQCDVCKRVLRCADSLATHKLKHTGDKPYTCGICNKGFVLSSTLKKHLRIHSGEDLYSCKICDKTFLNERNLRDHLICHTGAKPYQCEVCQKWFSAASSRKTHMSVHTGKKPFTCLICLRGFTDSSKLNAHMSLHTGMKKYACELCPKSFTYPWQLNKHVSIHYGEKPHCCSICSKEFSYIQSLKHHMSIHTGEEQHYCAICEKRFTHHGHLRRHMRKHNSDIWCHWLSLSHSGTKETIWPLWVPLPIINHLLDNVFIRFDNIVIRQCWYSDEDEPRSSCIRFVFWPTAHWWAYSIGRPPSSVCRRRPHSLNISSEPTGSIKVNFYLELLWDVGTKVCSNGHMTKMAASPIYGKNL